ncbi:hypothetical protein H6758_04665 [Candidatus Nomurabacteria bacterium]|nr:hypothetical protein [Candidatus Nomurabacteria bacterium]
MPTFVGQCARCSKEMFSVVRARVFCEECTLAQSGEKPSVADEQHAPEKDSDQSMGEGSEPTEKDSE